MQFFVQNAWDLGVFHNLEHASVNKASSEEMSKRHDNTALALELFSSNFESICCRTYIPEHAG
jgi:hypothetical protein